MVTNMTQPSNRLILLAIASTALTGCVGVFWGNLLVVAMTFGIFYGTLALGRVRSDATRSGGPAASHSSSRLS